VRVRRARVIGARVLTGARNTRTHAHQTFAARAPAAMSLDESYVLQACASLVAHVRKSATGASLFEDSTSLTLEIRLKEMPGRAKAKQLRM
jgi:hypothetical protein